MAQLRSE